jgi:protein-ribulosamine 3-kinase
MLITPDRLRAIGAALAKSRRLRTDPLPQARVHGGSIDECYRFQLESGALFVKVAPAGARERLQAEADGLAALERARAVRVPRVLARGTAADCSYLALEWIDLAPRTAAAAAQLGTQLALQHREAEARFGWHRDNTIGATPQPNAWCADWTRFWHERRLGFQLELAARNGHRGSLQQLGAQLLERLGALLGEHRPAASLLHGDLWGGNWGVDAEGRPVIFDPAVYYGDRETDLAMTGLFGGFPAEFYTAYGAAWPLDAGASRRRPLYELYHVLNHLNLFGSGYLQQAEALLQRLLEL